MFRTTYLFLKKYKIIHLLFWTWVTISLTHELQAFRGGTLQINLQYAVILEFFEACSVYFTIYFLVPRFLNKRKYFSFLGLTLASLIFFAWLSGLAEDLFTYLVLGKHIKSILVATLSQSFDSAIKTGVFLTVVVIQNRLETDNRNKQLESEHLKSELDFLKAQINPHFLFNTINNIYVLIEEDKKLASLTLLRFSELLRYQLYDCNAGKMPVSKEIEFLNNFIRMEQLRTGDQVLVELQMDPEPGYFEIAPFILLPFVENAFKHVSHDDARKNTIFINSHMDQGVFHFSVINSCDDRPETAGRSGIGLANVKRRLELIYPDKYELDIQKKNGFHQINLKLHVT